jgi:hypothetical protein
VVDAGVLRADRADRVGLQVLTSVGPFGLAEGCHAGFRPLDRPLPEPEEGTVAPEVLLPLAVTPSS